MSANAGSSPTGSTRLQLDESRLDKIFALFDRCHAPGVAVGVSLAGRPVYRKGWGLANLEQPLALTPTTRMRVASVTKHFTCLSYLLLCEDGRARPDDPIGVHVDGLHPVVAEARIDQLMRHVSGLRDADDMHHQLCGTSAAASIEDLCAFYRRSGERNAAPGTTWRYNNGGYLLLQRAIETIAGLSLSEFMTKRIFAPLGMNDTGIRPWNSDFLANSATMHMVATDGRFVKDYLNREHGGDGGLVSTVDDMLRWLAHIRHPTIGAAETWNHMTRPHLLEGGLTTKYAAGLAVTDFRGRRILSHSGGLMGAKAHLLFAPDDELGIIVISNRHDVSATFLALAVLEACVNDLAPPDSEQQHVPSVGLFVSPRTGRVIELRPLLHRQGVSIDGVDLSMARGGERLLRHHPAADYLLQSINLRGDLQHPSAIEFIDCGAVDVLERVPATSTQDFPSIAARYFSADADAELEINANSATSRGTFGHVHFDLEWLAPTLARLRARANMPWGGILSFEDDELYFSTFTTTRLRFQRV